MDAAEVARSNAAAYAILRDDIAAMRDANATLRDLEAEVRETTDSSAIDTLQRAASDRAEAAADRRHAAGDRIWAAEYAQLDGLTGLHVRDAGLLALEREVTRARALGEPFVLAFIDVDGLKEVNDRDGHRAGDALLLHVSACLRDGLGAGDVIVRVGGDEFLYGFAGTDLAPVRQRVGRRPAAIAAGAPASSISVGLARLEPEDTLVGLIRRADLDMYARRAASPQRG